MNVRRFSSLIAVCGLALIFGGGMGYLAHSSISETLRTWTRVFQNFLEQPRNIRVVWYDSHKEFVIKSCGDSTSSVLTPSLGTMDLEQWLIQNAEWTSMSFQLGLSNSREFFLVTTTRVPISVFSNMEIGIPMELREACERYLLG
jgi:hypothetical protein